MPILLLIEDEATLAKNVERYLERHGWDVEIAGSAEEGLARVASVQPDVVVLDFQLPGMDGLAALATIRERDPQARVVMLTGHGSIKLAVDAMKAGAADFLSKPVVLADLKRVLDRLAGEGRMRNELAYYHKREAGGLEQIAGESAPILELKGRIRRLVEAEAGDSGGPAPCILITGETGSGKELVARACHYESRRRDGPFMEVNCAAIPANLLESELFGYERGAFTGARERKVGLIEAADGGTLFLDEIGEADAATQAKLLKVLEDRRIRRLGGLQERHVDVRVIAATNQLLEQRAQEGRFRADLLYRLRVVQLEVPPLRERGGDAILLAGQFLGQFARRYGKPGLSFAPSALEAIARHDWPGNVRELRNLIERTVLLAQGGAISAAELALPAAGAAQARPPTGFAGMGLALEEVERDLVRNALERTGWNVTHAARILGITRDTLRYRMEKHGLRRD
jgi:two-component system response regulator AtoC